MLPIDPKEKVDLWVAFIRNSLLFLMGEHLRIPEIRIPIHYTTIQIHSFYVINRKEGTLL